MEDIVNIFSGVRLVKNRQTEGDIPFVGATDNNNGITNFVRNINKSLDRNLLGINYNGSVVENFYHPYNAIFSDDVKRIHWKCQDEGNEYTYLFLKTMILQQKGKYAYGYKFNAKRMKRQKILLPVNENGGLAYTYMKKYTQVMEVKRIYEVLNYLTDNN